MNVHERDSYHKETPSDPDLIPSVRASWYGLCLTVYCQDMGRSLAHDTPTDVLLDVSSPGRVHHVRLLVGGQPEAVIVSGGNRALSSQITEHEGHGAETWQAGTGLAQILTVSTFVTLSVQETVSVPHLGGS